MLSKIERDIANEYIELCSKRKVNVSLSMICHQFLNNKPVYPAVVMTFANVSQQDIQWIASGSG
jgi:hypothetical protein